MTCRSKIWHVTWILSFLNRGKNKFSIALKSMFFVCSILLYKDGLFYHFWEINYEQTFSIVNDHQSPWNFWCFFRNGNGTKMAHSWMGLTISWCLHHSRYEVYKNVQNFSKFSSGSISVLSIVWDLYRMNCCTCHKCDRKNSFFLALL